MRDTKRLNDLIAVAVTDGSITRSIEGEVSLTWRNSTGGRSTLSPIVDLFDGSSSDATDCIEWAKANGVLVIDFYGCPFDKVACWVIKGPMMREQFEPLDPDWIAAMFPAGSPLSNIDTREWCLKAIEATGCVIHNIPAETEKHQ